MPADRNTRSLCPTSDQMAMDWLVPALDLRPAEVQEMTPRQFQQAWTSIAFLYAGLHPDEATNHGTEVSTVYDGEAACENIDERLLAAYYEQSGWPLALAPLAAEAWRRFDAGLLADDELYCSGAQRAGMIHRNPSLAS